MQKTTNRIRGTTPEIERAARQLRLQLTPAESLLWKALKNRKLNGLRFRTQHPIGRFILDFYCPSCKLAIEVDGDIHVNQTEQDAARTEHLEIYGYRVLRFSNEEVLNDLNRVLEAIKDAASEISQAESLEVSPPKSPNSGGL